MAKQSRQPDKGMEHVLAYWAHIWMCEAYGITTSIKRAKS